jgi:hypothetical protein
MIIERIIGIGILRLNTLIENENRIGLFYFQLVGTICCYFCWSAKRLDGTSDSLTNGLLTRSYSYS